jgi:hypothetical protein
MVRGERFQENIKTLLMDETAHREYKRFRPTYPCAAGGEFRRLGTIGDYMGRSMGLAERH